MTQTSPLSSQGDINAEVDELHRAAPATAAQPQLHFPPYRSSVLRAPTKDLVQVDPETVPEHRRQQLRSLHLSAGQAVDERPPGDWHAEWPALRRLLVLTATAADQSAELAEHLTVDAAAPGARAEQEAASLLAENPAAGDVRAYLGSSEELVRRAVQHWLATHA